MNIFQKSLALLLSWSLVIGTVPGGAAYASQSVQSEAQPANTGATQSPEELQQLVAPIALYPDALVSQILAAATYPTEVVEADRWMQGHPNLKGQELANEVDKQAWDSSVKALTQFPSAAARLGMNRTTLLSRMKKFGIYPKKYT
jgi:transcriptional regulator with GAF, ATPase, and Fis domain